MFHHWAGCTTVDDMLSAETHLERPVRCSRHTAFLWAHLAHHDVVACRGKVVQIGSPEELQSAPATPFVLHFIDDVNLMPANCQFVRRLGYKTEKPYVMCRPTVFDVRSLCCWSVCGFSLLVEPLHPCSALVHHNSVALCGPCHGWASSQGTSGPP